MSAAVLSRYPAEYPAVTPQLPGQSVEWLQKLRADALVKFAERGFPTTRDEEWRYTNLAALEKKLFTPVKKSELNELDQQFIQTQQLHDAWSVVLIDGHFCPEYSVLEDLPDAVIVMSIADALETQSPLLKDYLGQSVTIDEHNGVAFNTAWFADGILINVPAQTVLSKPLQILHVATQADSLACTRHIVVMGALSELNLIESHLALPTLNHSYLSSNIIEVNLAQGAQLTAYKLQAEAEQAYHLGGMYVQQARNARFSQHHFAFGGLLARNDVHTQLSQGAECYLNGLFSGVKRQHLDNHTRIVHQEGHASSRELYKGILDERARGVFQGRVIVAEQAQKTDSQMNNRNLLLSSDTEVDTKPQLEIYADDVKCAHGVTVGQLDEKAIFYLVSRGIDEDTARNMLTFAFANEMVEKITLPSFHDQVLQRLLSRFPQAGVQQDWL